MLAASALAALASTLDTWLLSSPQGQLLTGGAAIGGFLIDSMGPGTCPGLVPAGSPLSPGGYGFGCVNGSGRVIAVHGLAAADLGPAALGTGPALAAVPNGQWEVGYPATDGRLVTEGADDHGESKPAPPPRGPEAPHREPMGAIARDVPRDDQASPAQDRNSRAYDPGQVARRAWQRCPAANPSRPPGARQYQEVQMFKVSRVHLPVRPQSTGGGHRWHGTGGHGASPPDAVAVPRIRRLAARGVIVLVTAVAVMAGMLAAVPGAQASGFAYWHPNGVQANVFYVGNDLQIHNWYWTGSTWTNSALGSGEPADPSTGLSAVWNPDGVHANVFYIGANGQIYNWYWTGSSWTNAALGSGEPAAEDTGLSAVWSPNGAQVNVFYTGANGQIYNWYWTGSKWANAALGSGEPAAEDSGLSAVWSPNGAQVNVFYTGADGQIYNWWGTGSTWANGSLGSGMFAQQGSGLAAYWHPNGAQANVFYIAVNGQIYNWYWTGSTWTNSALGIGAAADQGTGLSAYWHPNGVQANVFYTAANGQIYNWYWTGSTWTNSALGNGAANEGTDLSAMWNPNGVQANVYYTGDDDQMYNWYWTGSTWTNSAL